MTLAQKLKTTEKIKTAEMAVTHGVRAWLFYTEGGDLVIQLNDPEPINGGPMGATIMHAVTLHESKPEAISQIRNVLRGWVMGRVAAME